MDFRKRFFFLIAVWGFLEILNAQCFPIVPCKCVLPTWAGRLIPRLRRDAGGTRCSRLPPPGAPRVGRRTRLPSTTLRLREEIGGPVRAGRIRMSSPMTSGWFAGSVSTWSFLGGGDAGSHCFSIVSSHQMNKQTRKTTPVVTYRKLTKLMLIC